MLTLLGWLAGLILTGKPDAKEAEDAGKRGVHGEEHAGSELHSVGQLSENSAIYVHRQRTCKIFRYPVYTELVGSTYLQVG